MDTTQRGIGPIGTAVRAFGGLALLYAAGGANGLSWAVRSYDPILGFVALPAIMIGLGLLARRYSGAPVRLTAPLGITLNTAAILALVSNEYTSRERSCSTERRCSSLRGGGRPGARRRCRRTWAACAGAGSWRRAAR